MALLRILIHSVILCLVNLGAVLAGFAVYKISGVAYQLAVQIPVAVAISVGAFVLWYIVIGRVTSGRAALAGLAGYLWAYALAFGWLPALVVPLHFVARGYLTSFANIYYAWLFQAPTNALALAVTYALMRRTFPLPQSS